VIDFRYHLVSIVSIFLALAVGIVLGAGPLQQQIGRTLTSQVATLRQEKVDLRTQLTALQKENDAADGFATAVTPQLVASRLGGRSVVVVRLPGSSSSVVDDLGATLRASGATVNGVVSVESAWVDPARRTVRDEVTGQASTPADATAAPDATLEDRMGDLLARALVVDQLGQANRASATSQEALSTLKDAGMIGFSGDGPAPATLALVVGGPPDAEADADQQTAELAAWTAIASRLDAASSGAVVAGPPESAASGGAVAAVRAEGDVRKDVSTVDDAAQPIGRLAVVYALRQQMAGEAGQYGYGPGASAVLPPLADAR
jgi:hypothetical protein